MKQKTIMILAGIAAALQTAAVLLAVFMVVNQKAVKGILGTSAMYEVNSFPTGAMIELLLPMLIYGIFLLCIAAVKGKPSQRQILAIIFVILAVLFKIMSGLVLSPFSSTLQARRGSAEFASYTVLNSAISQVTLLFTVAAFALFCMAAGSCLPVKTEPAASLQDAGQENMWRSVS